MNATKRAFLAGIVVGFTFGFLGHALLTKNHSRFVLEAAGDGRSVYKLDTKTGQVWQLYGREQTLLQ